MNAKLCQNLQCPSEMFIIQGFIADTNKAQDLWTDLYSSHYGKVKDQGILSESITLALTPHLSRVEWSPWPEMTGPLEPSLVRWPSSRRFSPDR